MTGHGRAQDTDLEVHRQQVERWRSMPIAERVELLDAMHRDVEQLAIIGIRRQHPDAGEEEVRYLLCRRRHGAQLADAAFGRARPE
jgi:hypothetical protein